MGHGNDVIVICCRCCNLSMSDTLNVDHKTERLPNQTKFLQNINASSKESNCHHFLLNDLDGNWILFFVFFNILVQDFFIFKFQ